MVVEILPLLVDIVVRKLELNFEIFSLNCLPLTFWYDEHWFSHSVNPKVVLTLALITTQQTLHSIHFSILSSLSFTSFSLGMSPQTIFLGDICFCLACYDMVWYDMIWFKNELVIWLQNEDVIWIKNENVVWYLNEDKIWLDKKNEVWYENEDAISCGY